MSALYELFTRLKDNLSPLQSPLFIETKDTNPELAKDLKALLYNRDEDLALKEIFFPMTNDAAQLNRLGRIIENKYQIVELIGSGGMSDVYLAQRIDGLIEHKVAVKYYALAPNFDTALEHIKKEAQLLATIDHHFIASFIDIGHDETGEPNVMMEYIEGITLSEFLDTQPTPERLEKVNQSLNHALVYLQNMEIAHKDLSSNNILIDVNGNANIIDFDLSTKS